MRLSQLSKAVSDLGAKKRNHSVLIYGLPKTGKTRLVGTAAEIPELQRIIWVDLENGVETLLHSGLSPQALEKIELIKIPDTRDTPRGIETVLKMFSSKTPIKICEEHGKVACLECQKADLPSVEFCLSKLTNRDLLVIDSGSQLGDSAMNLAMLGRPIEMKPGWDEYSIQGKYLGDILSVMQAAQFTNFVMITHVVAIEEEHNGVKRDKLFPLIGSKQFCQKVAKYFGTVAFLEIKMNKHAAGSSSTYRSDAITGSRVGALFEKNKDGPNMKSILIEGGILT